MWKLFFLSDSKQAQVFVDTEIPLLIMSPLLSKFRYNCGADSDIRIRLVVS